MQFKRHLTALALAMGSVAAFAQATVGVSWSNFQEERWKTDEAAIKAQLEKSGAKYISADAGGSPEKQLADIDGLIAKGAKVVRVRFDTPSFLLYCMSKGVPPHEQTRANWAAQELRKKMTGR